MKRILVALVALISMGSVQAGEWIEAGLNHIELTPTTGFNAPEGVWFAKDSPYQTAYSCTNGNFISVKDPKLATRALAVALYAKSAGGKVRIYVTGCDAGGYLEGVSVMLVS